MIVKYSAQRCAEQAKTLQCQQRGVKERAEADFTQFVVVQHPQLLNDGVQVPAFRIHADFTDPRFQLMRHVVMH